jgi:hypothetical protein
LEKKRSDDYLLILWCATDAVNRNACGF